MDAMMIMMYSQLCNYVLLMGCGHLKGEKNPGQIAGTTNYVGVNCSLSRI